MSRLQEIKRKYDKKITGSLRDFFAREHARAHDMEDELRRIAESDQITISVHVREEATE